jgi:hypothetical protein
VLTEHELQSMRERLAEAIRHDTPQRDEHLERVLAVTARAKSTMPLVGRLASPPLERS